MAKSTANTTAAAASGAVSNNNEISALVAFLRKNLEMQKSRWIAQYCVVQREMFLRDKRFECIRHVPETQHYPEFLVIGNYEIAVMSCKQDFSLAILIREL